jgi:hypothetical protein
MAPGTPLACLGQKPVVVYWQRGIVKGKDSMMRFRGAPFSPDGVNVDDEEKKT